MISRVETMLSVIPHTHKQWYLGVVKDNNDPNQLGRVKVACDLYKKVDDAYLPWAIPLNFSGIPGAKMLYPPDIDSKVFLFCPFGDIHLPTYIPMHVTSTVPDAIKQDYPDSFGWEDKTGSYFRVDKKTGDVEFYHGPSQSKITLDSDGNIDFYFPGNWTAKAHYYDWEQS